MVSASMFGEFFHNLDAKGRLSIPAKFRDSLGSTVVIAQGPERCIRLYSQEEWDEFVNGLYTQIDTSQRKGRELFRRITAKAAVCDLDAQGRIIIGPAFRAYANITKEVAVVGSGNKAEIWNRERYDEIFGDDDFDDEAFEADLAEFGVHL